MGNSRHSNGCIYCGEAGPFTDEHVISAGLGGDDKAWMLRDCVCGTCNSKRFSALETHLLKQSHVSIARLFMQKSTRDRNTPPSLQPRSSYYRDPVSNLLLVVEFKAGGESEVLPQVVLDSQIDRVAITGTPGKALDEFLDALQAHRAGFALIQKRGPRTFYSAKAVWTGSSFETEEWLVHKKPPENGVWLEELALLTTQSVREIPPTSIHRRAKGQMVCRATDLAAALKFLSVVCENFEELRSESGLARPQKDDQPTIHLRLSIDDEKVQRAIVKIGLNLVAFIGGAPLARLHEFDEAVGYVLDGTGSARKRTASQNQFGPAMHDRHVFVLFESRVEGVGLALMMAASLYGNSADVYILAMFPENTDPTAFSEPQVVHVDYNANRIELLDLVGHAQRAAISPSFA